MINTLQFRTCHEQSCKENSTCFESSKKDQNLSSFPEMGSDQIPMGGGIGRDEGAFRRKLSILKQFIEWLEFLWTDVSSLCVSYLFSDFSGVFGPNLIKPLLIDFT